MTTGGVSLLSRLTAIPLTILAGVNIWLVVGFWGSLGGGEPLPFQIFGGAIAAVEISAMVVAADAMARGEVVKARIWRAVFAAVLVVNVIADFGAITAKLGGDAAERAQAVARYDSAVRTDAEATAEIARLTAALDAQGLNLPADALAARVQGVEERRARYERLGRLPPRALIEQQAALESATLIARTLEAQRRIRDAARQQLRETGSRPETASAQITGIVSLAGMVGIHLAAESVRVVLAAALALVCKLVLVFGFWAISPQLRARREGANAPETPPKAGAERIETEGAGAEIVGTDRESEPPLAIETQGRAPMRRAPRRTPPRETVDTSFDQALDDLENGRA